MGVNDFRLGKDYAVIVMVAVMVVVVMIALVVMEENDDGVGDEGGNGN